MFLAGPTPRDDQTTSWRQEALVHFGINNFEGHIFVPESQFGEELGDQEPNIWARQVEWEKAAMARADAILFWIPRDMKSLPGLTTNNEFGNWVVKDPAKIVLGVPPKSPHTKYQIQQAEEAGVPTFDDLGNAIRHVCTNTQACGRTDGAVFVPAHIWNNEWFKAWHAAQAEAGNTLEWGEVLWAFKPRHSREPFCFAFHAHVWVGSEKRSKFNEFLLVRPDTFSVIPVYLNSNEPMGAEVALVREFRTPGRTLSGHIAEPPGGSSKSFFGRSPAKLACEELFEETGLGIDPARLFPLSRSGRQVYGTMLSHKDHAYGLELTKQEMTTLREHARCGRAFGLSEDSELTTIKVAKVSDIVFSNAGGLPEEEDWGAVGRILTAVMMCLEKRK